MTTPQIDLENYILEEELGRGDLTIVYRGWRKSDGQQVAVKVVAPQFTFDRMFVRRFKEAVKQAAKLDHPNIVRTFEAGEEGEMVYIVREMIEARPLSEILEQDGPFSPQRMLNIARQIAAALDYAHQRSINHGDLSANRVYIGPDDHVTVADFGQTQAMQGTSLVKQGYAVGAPEIMAPERVRGQGASRQSDLYSLGILCYQMLAGRPPFTGPPAAVLHAQAYEQPRPLHIVNPAIPVALSETVERMLSKGLELRYNTGAEFARALAVAVEGTAPVRAPTTALDQLREAGLAPKPPLWKRGWVWAALAGALSIALLTAGYLVVANLVQNQNTAASLNQPAASSVSPAGEAVIAASPTPTPPAALPAGAPTEGETTTTPPPSTPVPTPTAVVSASLQIPPPPEMAKDSPFTNLRLAHAITEDHKPEKIGAIFAPGPQPVYLFFDYAGMQPGTPWTHRWLHNGVEMEAVNDTWPESYASYGTAWVYYGPVGGYQPGTYQVILEVNSRAVSTATFVIEPDGL